MEHDYSVFIVNYVYYLCTGTVLILWKLQPNLTKCKFCSASNNNINNNNSHLAAFSREPGSKKMNHYGFLRTRDDGMALASADHMQVICTSLQPDNHTNTSSLKFIVGGMACTS